MPRWYQPRFLQESIVRCCLLALGREVEAEFECTATQSQHHWLQHRCAKCQTGEGRWEVSNCRLDSYPVSTKHRKCCVTYQVTLEVQEIQLFQLSAGAASSPIAVNVLTETFLDAVVL